MLCLAGEREWWCHFSGPSHWYVRLQGAGDLVARTPEDWRSKGRGLSLHRRRDGHCHVRGEGLIWKPNAALQIALDFKG